MKIPQKRGPTHAHTHAGKKKVVEWDARKSIWKIRERKKRRRLSFPWNSQKVSSSSFSQREARPNLRFFLVLAWNEGILTLSWSLERENNVKRRSLGWKAEGIFQARQQTRKSRRQWRIFALALCLEEFFEPDEMQLWNIYSTYIRRYF